MDTQKKETPQKKILLVEDDTQFREAIKDYLELNNFMVREAENGRVARTIIELVDFDFDAVITDVQMPEMNGIELLQFVVNNKKTPVIVMTGFSELLEAKSAYDIGATEFLAKPFKVADIKGVLENILNPQKYSTDSSAKAEDEDLKYCTVDIDQFISGTKLVSDIYIKLGENKYIKLGHQGSEIDKERVKQYQAKGITHFHILVDDFKKYIGLNLLIANRAEQKGISKDRFGSLIKHTTEMILQDMFIEGIDKSKVSFAKNWVKNTLTAIADDKNLVNLMMILEENSAGGIYAHGVKVSMYSNLIAKQAGINSSHILFKVTLGGLMHDIGLREIPEELLTKQRVHMTQNELKMYESHVTRGRDLLNQIINVPDDVVLTAYYHHELYNGTGYPEGLRSARIPAIARIVTIADAFIDEITKVQTQHTLDTEIIKQTAQKLLKIRQSDFDPSLVVALLEILGLEIPDNLVQMKGSFVK